MFDIIIKDGKKESYIKLNGNKLEGFNAINGVVTPLTIEEVNTINLLKLSDDKSYLGSVNDYDIYVDNIAGLKHYFKDGNEDFEATWEHNGVDALIYKSNTANKSKEEVKKIRLKNKIICITKNIFIDIVCATIGASIALTILKGPFIIDGIKYETSKVSMVLSSEYTDNVTLEQVEKYIENNDNLTEEEKEIFRNEKLLRDVLPYYENTNMNILIPLKFDDLQIEYYYEEPSKIGGLTDAYYNFLIPNKIFSNTYHYPTKDIYNNLTHEYIHLLQVMRNFSYIREASAEIVSSEYYDECSVNCYQEAVKNVKILMEIVGPEPIWKLNFNGDDTDLVNIIRANLSEEEADKLIRLLKKEPYSSQMLDEEIYSLLSQMYFNMYNEDIRMNSFISNILDNKLKNRYYFNSELIEKEAPYIKYNIDTHYFAYVVSNNPILVTEDKLLDKNSEELIIISKNKIKINSLKDLTEEIIKLNEISFYYHGEEINLESIDINKYGDETVIFTNWIEPEFEYKMGKSYLPNIYESFPEQRIGGNNFTK